MGGVDLPLHIVSLPLNTRFRGVGHREIALVEGPAGWGEFSPFLEYEPEEAARWLATQLEQVAREGRLGDLDAVVGEQGEQLRLAADGVLAQ
mgnify:CR=1 FL=1